MRYTAYAWCWSGCSFIVSLSNTLLHKTLASVSETALCSGTVFHTALTCESCCGNEGRLIPAKHHGLWLLFPLPAEVFCELKKKRETRKGKTHVNFFFFLNQHDEATKMVSTWLTPNTPIRSSEVKLKKRLRHADKCFCKCIHQWEHPTDKVKLADLVSDKFYLHSITKPPQFSTTQARTEWQRNILV